MRKDCTIKTRDQTARKRRNLGHITPDRSTAPATRTVLVDNKDAVLVPLSGRHGQKREMLLDPEAWKMIRQYEEWWLFGVDPLWWTVFGLGWFGQAT